MAQAGGSSVTGNSQCALYVMIQCIICMTAVAGALYRS